jgi:hypothetical protein
MKGSPGIDIQVYIHKFTIVNEKVAKDVMDTTVFRGSNVEGDQFL